MKSWLTAAAAALIFAPTTALACGGFFCMNDPMDQAGEEILFGVDPSSGTVQAVIRIFYEGEAEDFAWVLPLPSVPTIGTSSDEVFTIIQQRTRPMFQVDWDIQGECGWGGWNWFDDGMDPMPEAGSGGGADGGVTIIDSGQVGAFDYTIVKSDDGEAMFDWLNDNGYVQPPTARPLIDHYVVQDMVFVALKLQQNAGSGDITPVVLEFQEQAPCVPIVLTQIAALPDMPVRLYVASTERAVPQNWFGVEVNPKKIDWLNNGWNYEELVSAAVDEAAGRAFITEFAGSPAFLEEQLYLEGQYDLDTLRALPTAMDWVVGVQAQFQGTAALLNVFRAVVPMPAAAAADGIDEMWFYNWPWDHEKYYSLIDFDAGTATDVLDERIVQPRKEAQALVDRYPYFTRLYTKLSPEEMTRDPIFAFNSGLPDVPLVRTATGTIICDGDEVIDVQITPPGAVEPFKPEIPGWWGPPAGYEADSMAGEPDAGAIWLLPSEGPAYEVQDRTLIPFLDNQFFFKTSDQLIAELTGDDGEGGPGEGGPGEGGPGEGGPGEGGPGEGGASEEGGPGEGGSGSDQGEGGTSNGSAGPGSGSGDGTAPGSGGSRGGCAAGGGSSAPLAGLALLTLVAIRRRRD